MPEEWTFCSIWAVLAGGVIAACGGDGGHTDAATSQVADAAAPDAPLHDAQMMTTTLSYDDGASEASISPWDTSPGSQVAVRFTPPGYPAKLESAQLYVTSDGLPTTTFQVRVYDDNEAGDQLNAQTIVASATAGDTWVDVDLGLSDITVTDGDFIIAMYWSTSPGEDGENAQFIGTDESEPDGRSYWMWASEGFWKPHGNGDFMIRATVHCPEY